MPWHYFGSKCQATIWCTLITKAASGMDELALPAEAQCWILHRCKGVRIAHPSLPNAPLHVLVTAYLWEKDAWLWCTMVLIQSCESNWRRSVYFLQHAVCRFNSGAGAAWHVSEHSKHIREGAKMFLSAFCTLLRQIKQENPGVSLVSSYSLGRFLSFYFLI